MILRRSMDEVPVFSLFDEKPIQAYEPPVALTIAGSDSGGGSGIQADLKTFAACKVFGTAVLTLVKAQSTRGVAAQEVLSEAMVAAQLAAVVDDLRPVAAKTGALGSERMIAFLGEQLQERPLERLVVDPVLVSKQGRALVTEAAVATFRAVMLPVAELVTPNAYEAEALTGRSVSGIGSMKDAAKVIFDLGARHVLIKGSQLDESVVRDIFYDGTGFIEFGADRIKSEALYGSGCAFSAAITARLAHGDALEEAVEFAREFISGAISKAPNLGAGSSPVNPMHAVWSS